MLMRARLWPCGLAPRDDKSELNFNAKRRQVKDDNEWQEIIAEQPWTASKRRLQVAAYLCAKVEADDPALQVGVGRWAATPVRRGSAGLGARAHVGGGLGGVGEGTRWMGAQATAGCVRAVRGCPQQAMRGMGSWRLVRLAVTGLGWVGGPARGTWGP